MKKTLIVCLMATVFSSCGNDPSEKKPEVTETPKANKLEKLNWVLGAWQNQTPEGLFIEQWEKVNDDLYSGHGLFITSKGDTQFSEQITIERSGDTLYYKPVVSNQNGGKEVVFTEQSFSNNEVVFENTTHDFPQRIIYTHPTDSTLHARIEGTVNGAEKKEEFNFKKK